MSNDVDKYSILCLQQTSTPYPSVIEALDGCVGVSALPECIMAYVTEDDRVVSLHQCMGLNSDTQLARGQKLIRFPTHGAMAGRLKN